MENPQPDICFKVCSKRHKKLSTKEYLHTHYHCSFKKKKKTLSMSKWAQKIFQPAPSCSSALLVNGGLTQEAYQVRTRPLITHSNYHLTGFDGSSKEADSSLLKGFPPYQSHASSSAAICRYRVHI